MPPVLPINLEDILGIVMAGLVVLIPVIGITARFALKPIAESLTQLRRAQDEDEAQALLERRVALIEQELHQLSGLRTDLSRLIEEQEFRNKLAAK